MGDAGHGDPGHGDPGHGQRVSGDARAHAEQFGEFGQRPAPGTGWTQIRKHGQRLPLITVR